LAMRKKGEVNKNDLLFVEEKIRERMRERE